MENNCQTLLKYCATALRSRNLWSFFPKTGVQSLLPGTVVLYRQRMCIWEINGTLLNIILNLTQKQPWTCKPSRRWARSKKATRAAASVERPASPPAPRTLPPEQPSIPLDLFYS